MKKFSVFILAALVLLTFMVNPTSLYSKAKVGEEILEESGLYVASGNHTVTLTVTDNDSQTDTIYKADASSCKCLDYVRIFGSDLVDENSTNQYTARAYFSDGSSQDVTGLATWNLDSPVHSTLSQTGVLTVYDVEETGYCRISAFYNFNGTTKSGYKDVTVLPWGQWPPL